MKVLFMNGATKLSFPHAMLKLIVLTACAQASRLVTKHHRRLSANSQVSSSSSSDTPDTSHFKPRRRKSHKHFGFPDIWNDIDELENQSKPEFPRSTLTLLQKIASHAVVSKSAGIAKQVKAILEKIIMPYKNKLNTDKNLMWKINKYLDKNRGHIEKIAKEQQKARAAKRAKKVRRRRDRNSIKKQASANRQTRGELSGRGTGRVAGSVRSRANPDTSVPSVRPGSSGTVAYQAPLANRNPRECISRHDKIPGDIKEMMNGIQSRLDNCDRSKIDKANQNIFVAHLGKKLETIVLEYDSAHEQECREKMRRLLEHVRVHIPILSRKQIVKRAKERRQFVLKHSHRQRLLKRALRSTGYYAVEEAE